MTPCAQGVLVMGYAYSLKKCVGDRRIGDDTLCLGGLPKGLGLFLGEMCRG